MGPVFQRDDGVKANTFTVIPAQAGTHDPLNEVVTSDHFRYLSNHPTIRLRKSFWCSGLRIACPSPS